ncbi:MAG: hypothetical protein LBR85_07375 [Oscillospiraceae bacterium]|jgi:hypothetical protein|nr:hypothetical protein [Oscillospiraceae bacterium]
MVSVLNIENAKSRTFGWVQNPGNFRSLCDVVAIHDANSAKHLDLRSRLIPALVSPEDGQAELISALDARPLRIGYVHLVGTGTNPRANAPCNAIIQAAVRGQRKPYTDDWTAAGFVRWAYCLGFIRYNYAEDSFSITESGLRLSAARAEGDALSPEERSLLVEAVLAYPPAIRVLSLLAQENAHLTKFEIGRKLGFTGEGGFTSMPQSVLIRAMSETTDPVEKTRMRNNWEGTSDKYARMISSWLVKLGLARSKPKSVKVIAGAEACTELIGHAFEITAQGIAALRRAKGTGRHWHIKKNICYEMFATKGAGREFLRKRRALVLKKLAEAESGRVTISELSVFLKGFEIESTPSVIADDICGFINMGLDVCLESETAYWRDSINGFVIPIFGEATRTPLEERKDELRAVLKNISHEYLSLIDLAYDSVQHRLFEAMTLKLLTDEYGYAGLHLGGGRKPDGVIYTEGLENDYGVIIDTKAYAEGYSVPIAQADEMQRYIQENQRRDALENPNKWWRHFAEPVRLFYFMFVSGHFKGQYSSQISRIIRITGVAGAAVEIFNLLLTAERVKGGEESLSGIARSFFPRDYEDETLS